MKALIYFLLIISQIYSSSYIKNNKKILQESKSDDIVILHILYHQAKSSYRNRDEIHLTIGLYKTHLIYIYMYYLYFFLN